MRHTVVVGMFLLLVMVLALHDGVIRVNIYLLHKRKWQAVKWAAGILGGVIINALLR